MQSIFDAITEWLKELLVEGIMGNLGGLFTNVNEQVGEIAAQVGTTPAAWNAGVFSMIRQLSETVILPIAGLVLTFVMTYELIQMLIDHNNLHNFDTWIFFKWIFKTFVAVMILSNTFNIVMAVFDVSQQVIQQSAGLIQGSTAVTPDVLNDMQTQLEAMELGPLLGIFLQSFFVQFTMTALSCVKVCSAASPRRRSSVSVTGCIPARSIPLPRLCSECCSSSLPRASDRLP